MDYNKFKVMMGRYKDVPVYYAYVECPLAFQGAPIPQAAIDIVHGLATEDIPAIAAVEYVPAVQWVAATDTEPEVAYVPAVEAVEGKPEILEGESLVTGLTIEDYSLMVFANDETMVVSLGARTHSYGRLNPVGVDEMANWESFLAPLGLGSDKWYTRDEYQARMLELRPPEEF